VETLRAGIAAGNTPARRQAQIVAETLSDYLQGEGYFARLAADAPSDVVSGSLRAALTNGAERAKAAYGYFAEFLTMELLPAATEEDAVGRDLYSLHSRRFLGAAVDLDETYEWGLAELERMRNEQEAVAEQILPGATVSEAIAHLDSDPARKLHGTDALREWMQQTSDQAIADLGREYFDIADALKNLHCMIAPTTSGEIYYTPPTDDFSRPGQMWWSVPEGVTEFSTWREKTTVYHEGVPGHHLQLAQAIYNRGELNLWRRAAGTSGHAEFWALYAERLMQELGYMDDPVDCLGCFDSQRLRAERAAPRGTRKAGRSTPSGSCKTSDTWTIQGSCWASSTANACAPRASSLISASISASPNLWVSWAAIALERGTTPSHLSSCARTSTWMTHSYVSKSTATSAGRAKRRRTRSGNGFSSNSAPRPKRNPTSISRTTT